MNIMDAQVPSQRWALPTDSLYDKYYKEFEWWINDNYNMQDQMIRGIRMTWEDACESDDIFQMFIDEWTDRSE